MKQINDLQSRDMRTEYDFWIVTDQNEKYFSHWNRTMMTIWSPLEYDLASSNHDTIENTFGYW